VDVAENEPFIVDYARPEVDGDIPFIRPMQLWRSVCGVCFWTVILASFLSPLLALLAGAAAVVTGLIAIIYMGRAALAEVGAGYAARHVVLAVALSIVFLLGVWVVPSLVQSDLIKWRAVEDRNRETC
jgi:hypothetical protein